VSPQAWFFTFAPIAVIGPLMAIFWSGPWTATKIAGLVLAAVGYALVTIARVQLGDAFSINAEAKTLVTRGLYSRIRHPVYVFSAIGLVGLALYFEYLPLAILAAVAIPIQLVRARREDRVLEERFGDAYRRYRDGTWF